MTSNSDRVSPRLGPCQSHIPPGRRVLLCPCVGLGSAGSPSSAEKDLPLTSFGTVLLPQEGYELGGSLLGPTQLLASTLSVFWKFSMSV